jgi:hypothetical protein
MPDKSLVRKLERALEIRRAGKNPWKGSRVLLELSPGRYAAPPGWGKHLTQDEVDRLVNRFEPLDGGDWVVIACNDGYKPTRMKPLDNIL